MKDYSSYYSHSNDILLSNLKIIFQKRLDSLEGEDILIDGISCKVVLLEHTNPLNEDKEDRKILIPNTISFHRGSIVTWKGEHWLIVNDISATDDNGVYIEGKILKQYNTINWVDADDKLIKTYSCISTIQLLSSLGINEGSQLTTVDTVMNITITSDIYTNKLKNGMRFIFNHKKAYKITFINDIEFPNLLAITLEQTETIATDDLANNIGDNGVPANTPSTTGYSIVIFGSDTVTQGASQTYTATIYNNGTVVTDKTVTWTLLNEAGTSTLDTSIATLSVDSNNSCTVNGLKMGEYGTLKAVLNDDSSVSVSKSLSFVGGW